MAYIQLSLFGKTSMEHFYQITGWILSPSLNPSQAPKFQCLLPKDGQVQEWCEGEKLTSAGALWMPDIGESPHYYNEEGVSFSWRILEETVAEKDYLSPAVCSRILHLAEKIGVPPLEFIEAILLKQGGKYRSSTPFKRDECEERQRKETEEIFLVASDGQMILSLPYLHAGGINHFAFWYEGDEENGFIRYLTPTECERLQGLPEDWTKFGTMGEEISTGARCKALGNSIALPCAEHIMQGIYKVLKGGEKPCRKK